MHELTQGLADDPSQDSRTRARLDQSMVGAQRLDICTSYISRADLEQLCDWLDRMDNKARVRVLIGMAADGWEDWGKDEITIRAEPFFLAQHFRPDQKYDQDAIPFLERLERQEADGRLIVKLRHPRSALHATLYVWTDAAGREEAWHANMPQLASTRDFVAWFDARWREQDSVGGPKLVEEARQVVVANRPDQYGKIRAARAGR